MSVELGHRLLASGALGPREIRAALQRQLAMKMPFVRALLELGHVSERALEEELARSHLPVLSAVVPLAAIVDELPRDLCRRLLAIPVRRDPRTGAVDVAVVDPYDAHIAEELAFHLKAEIRLQRAPLAAVEEALLGVEKGDDASAGARRHSAPPPLDEGRDRPPSDPPIPLVRRSARVAGGGVGDPIDATALVPTGGAWAMAEPVSPSFGGAEESAPRREERRSVPAPATLRGVFAPRAPQAPFPEIQGVLEAMDAALTRDDVIDCLIVGMRTVARRVGVFAVKRAGFRGVACNAELCDPASFRALEISTEAPTVLGIAVLNGSYLGPLPMTAPHEPLLRLLREPSREVTAVLVRVGGRPAVILFADELGDTMIATRRAEELAQQASRALSRVVQEAKTGRR